MPETTARIAAGLLAATFAWAGMAKLIAHEPWRVALAGYRFPLTIERIARPVVPIAELVVAVLIVAGRARVGAALSLALVGLFSFALARGRAIHGDRLPCGCFGGRDEGSAVAMMWRNGFLAILAVATISSAREPQLLAGLQAPAGTEIVAAVLVLAGLGLAVWMGWQAAGAFRRRHVP